MNHHAQESAKVAMFLAGNIGPRLSRSDAVAGAEIRNCSYVRKKEMVCMLKCYVFICWNRHVPI